MLMNGHYRAETREESRRGEEGKAVGGGERRVQRSGHRGSSGEKKRL